MDTQIIVSDKDIERYVRQLKKKEIYFFDVPEVYRLHPEIVRVERNLGIRKSDRRGYDVIRDSFFVEEVVLNKFIEEKKIINWFADFTSYYNFLNGDIYENSCYFQYAFSREEIKLYSLDINKINVRAFTHLTIKDFTIEFSKDEQKKYKTVERDKIHLKKWIIKFNACNSFDEFLYVIGKFKNSKFKASDLGNFFFYNFIFSNQEKALNIIMQYLFSDREDEFSYSFFSDIEKGLWYIYDHKQILSSYDFVSTIYPNKQDMVKKHKCKFKTYINQIENKEFKFYSHGYFSENTHFFCEEIRGCLDNNINLPNIQIYRFFETFEEFVAYKNNDLSYCDLSKALLPEVDFSNCKMNTRTKLPIQNARDLNYVISKSYDKRKNNFFVIQKWVDINKNIIKQYKNTFDYFFDFIAFLENDLSDADLLFCTGLENLTDVSSINLTNVKCRSCILEKLGVECPIYNKDMTDIKTFFPIIKNEKETFCILQSTRDLYGVDLAKGQKIYYISDLHLMHRICHADCKTQNDVMYLINRIVDNLIDDLIDDLRTDDNWRKKNITILIGGDVSSDYEIFKWFICSLRKTIDEQFIEVSIIFVLGNHELWAFPDSSLDEIVQRYTDLIYGNGMYLLQNDIIYKNDIGIYKISTQELLTLSPNDIREKLRSARLILFGGVGFSGYNKEFNANSGIYNKILSREQEIMETKKFEKLYNIVCAAISDKNVIILTHTPQSDWCADNDQQKGFVYVSGHTHKNYFYDDGDYRIYSDNQIGYQNENPRFKFFYLDEEYDLFVDYKDGIYQITKNQYKNFYRGKNLQMQFTKDINILYMLKKNGYYCFIHQGKRGQLTILNGGRSKKLEINNIHYYYNKMDGVIANIEKPLEKYTTIQKQIANEIIKIGGHGTIHGCIVDIDYSNHIYVNPNDLTITGYYAIDIVQKQIYPSIPNLLQDNCPLLYGNYIKLLKEDTTNSIVISGDAKHELINLPQEYLETDIYKASREISKMQKLNSNILSTWYEPADKMIE